MSEPDGSRRSIEFVDDNERFLFEEAKLGEDVREFLSSSVGKYVYGRAKIQLEEAKHELVSCTLEEVKEYQHKAQMAQQFIGWLSDAFSNGDMAYQTLQEYRNE